MSDQPLEQLFESDAKVKLLKLFLRNEGAKFSASEVRKRAQLDFTSASNTLEKLRLAGFLKSYSKNINNNNDKKSQKSSKPLKRLRLKKKRKGKNRNILKKAANNQTERIYFINPSFVFFNELKSLVLKSSPASKSKIVNRAKGIGRVKLVVLSGIFMRPDRELSRTDILIIGDDISEKRLQKFLKALEAEVGCEIQYSLLSSDEFRYRREMMDRFLRDIFERPNEVLIDKIGIQ